MGFQSSGSVSVSISISLKPSFYLHPILLSAIFKILNNQYHGEQDVILLIHSMITISITIIFFLSIILEELLFIMIFIIYS